MYLKETNYRQLRQVGARRSQLVPPCETEGLSSVALSGNQVTSCFEFTPHRLVIK